MTAIVGLVAFDGRVYVGGDRAYSDDHSTMIGGPKVARIGDCVIGFAGSPASFALLRRHWTPTGGGVAERYAQVLERSKDCDGETEFVVGHSGALYYLDPSGGVVRASGRICSAGGGGDVARAALTAYVDAIGIAAVRPCHAIKRALRIAACISLGVSGPFNVIGVS